MAIFTKKDKVALDQQSISTLISEGCTIDGNMKAPAFVRIDGQLTGEISVDEGLILGEKGMITGNVKTKEMIVYGTVNGNITASSLEIKSSGKINGDINTQILSVETGAVYNGSLSMTQTNKPEPRINGREPKVAELS
ncbi:MAG TPA: polymer-forming cytoskeletal protein [Mucilaginibacter sp.]|jgi:cytoskeletal protein CcmA (bactofilin family)